MVKVTKLSDLDITEVHNRTKIPIEYLKAIVAKDFEKLKNTNLKAYLQIINRDYNVDFSDYLDEVDAFLQENSQEDKKIIVRPSISSYKTKNEKSGSFLFLMIMLFVIGLIIWSIKFLNSTNLNTLTTLNQDTQKQSQETQEQNTSEMLNINITQASKVETNEQAINQEINQEIFIDTNLQANEELNITTDNITLENNNENINSATNTEINIENITADNVLEQNNEINASLVLDENVTKLFQTNIAESIEENKENNNTNEQNFIKVITNNTQLSTDTNLNSNTNLFDTANRIKITPIKKVWVGVKNLNTSKKSSFNATKPFDVDINGKILLVFGHGELDIAFTKNNTQNFRQANPLRFVIENKKARRIEFDEYVVLNKGKKW